MKKIFLLLISCVVFFGANAAEYTLFDNTVKDEWTDGTTSFTLDKTIDGVTFHLSYDKATSTSTLVSPIYYTEWRVYKNSEYTISSANAKITEVVVTYTASNYAKAGTLSDGWTGTLEGTVYTMTSAGLNSVTFTASEAQVRIKSIVVTAEVTGETPVDPDPVDPDPVDPDPIEPATLWSSLNQNSATCDWTFVNYTVPEQISDVWAWKTYNNLSYLNASGFFNGVAYNAESVAISPVVDLTAVKEASLTFESAAKFQTTIKDLCRLLVRLEGEEAWTPIEVQNWSAPGAWTWTNAGEYDLANYVGKKVQFGFKYGSTENGADTWEIRDFVIKEKTADYVIVPNPAYKPETMVEPDPIDPDPIDPDPIDPANAKDFVVFDIENPGTWTATEDGFTQTQLIDGRYFTITTNKAESTTTLISPANNTYSWRVYKNSTFTISNANEMQMAKIVITFDGTSYSGNCGLSDGWTGNLDGTTYTMTSGGQTTVTATASEKQVRIKKVVVTGDVSTGVDQVAQDTEAVYYNLNGQKVMNPANGLYIRIANGKASKVILK